MWIHHETLSKSEHEHFGYVANINLFNPMIPRLSNNSQQQHWSWTHHTSSALNSSLHIHNMYSLVAENPHSLSHWTLLYTVKKRNKFHIQTTENTSRVFCFSRDDRNQNRFDAALGGKNSQRGERQDRWRKDTETVPDVFLTLFCCCSHFDHRGAVLSWPRFQTHQCLFDLKSDCCFFWTNVNDPPQHTTAAQIYKRPLNASHQLWW